MEKLVLLSYVLQVSPCLEFQVAACREYYTQFHGSFKMK